MKRFAFVFINYLMLFALTEGVFGAVVVDNMTSERSENVCKDTANGATDKEDGDCDWYLRHSDHRDQCGNLDDDDFKANDVCCACGGGTGGTVEPYACNGHNDFDCGDGECVYWTDTCDGFSDCSDRSDESDEYADCDCEDAHDCDVEDYTGWWFYGFSIVRIKRTKSRILMH